MIIEHTPGPWYVLGLDVWSEEGKIAVSPSGVIEQIEANMRLIAAAPDLLEALENLVADADRLGIDFKPDGPARRAIAKARGEG